MEEEEEEEEVIVIVGTDIMVEAEVTSTRRGTWTDLSHPLPDQH